MGGRTGKVTITDVARAAGTSVSSASVALRGEAGVSEGTRERVLDVARGLGYEPDQRARALRQRRSRLIGVTFALGQTFHADVVEALYAAAGGTGHDLVLSATGADRSSARAAADLLRDRCEELILISPEMTERELVELAGRADVVTVASDLRAAGVDAVRSDETRGVAEALGHLVSLGHRSVTFVDGGNAAMAATRRKSYVESARRLGLEPRVLDGGVTEESGVDVADRVLEQRPTAVLAHNDMVAFGLLLTLRARGIAVPEDVSVVGYDNIRMSSLATVQLTSVSQDAATLAHKAVERAVERGSAPAEEIVTPAQLVVRRTSAPPRSSGVLGPAGSSGSPGPDGPDS